MYYVHNIYFHAGYGEKQVAAAFWNGEMERAEGSREIGLFGVHVTR